MTKRPNVLFLLSDEHSHRFLSEREPNQGGEPCRTPNLDRLIDQGTHLSTAYCQMPLCTPSRISMLTGRHAHRCGAWGNNSVLDPDIPTFGSHLRNHGYHTATVGKMHLGGSLQHAGFGARPYGDFGGPCGHQHEPIVDTGNESIRSRTQDAGISQIPESLLQEQMVVRESIAHLREHRHQSPDQPWLLHASFSRPHFPLTAPKRFFERYHPQGVTPPKVGYTGDSTHHPMTLGAIKGFRTDEIDHKEMMKARAAYFACVDYLDEILGDFLSILKWDGLLDDTVIIYASDHGEIAGEHGLWWKNTWHEAATRVPLIVSLPEQRSGELPAAEISQPVSLADLFPTICGLTETPLVDNLDGLDLSSAIRGETSTALEERPGVITESLTPRWGAGTEFRMIRSDRYKYIAFRDCEDLAFDIISDPLEQNNLTDSATGDVADHLTQLKSDVLSDFDFDSAESDRKRQTAELNRKYPKRVEPRTPNQIVLGDGRMVEADTPIYKPRLVSDRLSRDFDDFPGN
jgi:choline-sulfatase